MNKSSLHKKLTLVIKKKKKEKKKKVSLANQDYEFETLSLVKKAGLLNSISSHPSPKTRTLYLFMYCSE